MDYEKKYKEAVKAIKELSDSFDDDNLTNELSIIFPELKESEDEKISKALIKLVKKAGEGYENVIDGVSIENAISWLEKQGKNISLPKFTFDDVLALQCCMETAKKIQEDKELYEQLQSLHDRLHDAYWLEKQGEHTKFSESIQIGDKVTRNKDGVLVNLSQLNRVAKKQGEQKPAWSEEDINMIDWLIRCCEKEHKELCNDKYGHQDIVSDLKRDCRKKWDWLESLKNRVAPQKQWKPSDEQMELLREVQQALLGKDCHNRFVNFMYELKRLREE